MKKVLFVLVVMLVAMFTSCNKEEVSIPLNEDELRTQVIGVPMRSTDEFIQFAETNEVKTKAANMDNAPQAVVMVFPLDRRTISIDGSAVIKYFILYQFRGGNRTKEITISEKFSIKADGTVDTASGKLYEVFPGCPFKSEFYIKGYDGYQDVILSCNFADGRQITFQGQLLYGRSVKLPPLEGGVWQLQVGYYDGDLFQRFNTEPINFYGNTNEVGLKIEVGKDNIKSYIQIPKKYLNKANLIQIFSENIETGEITSYVEIIPVYDEILPEFVAYAIPFEYANRINIYTNEYRFSPEINPVLNLQINGKPVYCAE